MLIHVDEGSVVVVVLVVGVVVTADVVVCVTMHSWPVTAAHRNDQSKMSGTQGQCRQHIAALVPVQVVHVCRIAQSRRETQCRQVGARHPQ